MADRAKITSFDTLEGFQNTLIVYLDKAKRVLDEAHDEVRRTRTWVESDRRVHWLNEVKRRTRVLEMRQQELFSARIGNLAEPNQGHRQAVRQARKALEEATEKVEQVRRWAREFDNRVEPLARQVDKLRHTLTVDMGKAVASLKQTLESLHQYADVHPSQGKGTAADSSPEST